MSVRIPSSTLVSLVLGTTAALGLAEGVVRAFHLHSTTRFLAPHPVYGIFHVPGAKGWYVKGEVRQYVTINGRGLRDREPWGQERVLLLGDSFIAGFQVPLELTCQEVAEVLLSRALGRPVEVVAAACNGWGTVNQLAFLTTEGFAYAPQAVVLAFFPENDLMDNLGGASQDVPWPPRVRAPALASVDFLRSRGAAVLYDLLSPRCPRIAPYLTPATHRAHQAMVMGLSHLWREVPSPTATRMWTRTARLLAAMRDSVRAHGARFGVLLVPGRLSLYPQEVATLQARYPALARGTRPQAVRERVCAMLDSLGIPTLDPSPRFLELAARGVDPLFVKEGHWNAHGHRLAAQALVDLVVGQGLLAPTGSFDKSHSKEGT